MHTYKRHFAPIAIGHAAGDPTRALLLTDSDALAAWAGAVGLPVLRADGRAMADAAWRRALVARLDASAIACLVHGIGFDGDAAGQGFAAVREAAHGMLALMQALMQRASTIDIVVVRRPQSVTAAMLDGFAMTACQESARLRHAALVVADPLAEIPAQTLAQAIVACRAAGGGRHRLLDGRLERETVSPLDARRGRDGGRLRPGACHVVIGGTGGIGRLLARWLSERFGAQVCVIGRSAFDQGLRDTLKHHGVRAYAQADAADPDALVAALRSFATRFGRIDGVFHLAGVLRDRMIANKPASDLDEVLTPKVAVALNLARLPEDLRPGFVCAFTSLSGLVGNLGQSDYAAANAFVDALVDALAGEVAAPQAGTAWYSINWGLWASDGMRIDAAQADLQAMSPTAAFEALAATLQGEDRTTVAFEGDPAVLGGLDPSCPATPALRAAAPGLESRVADWIRERVVRLTRLKDLAVEDSLIEAGVDSATLISLVSAIEKHLSDASAGVRLGKAMVFDHPSIAALACHLCAAHADAVAAAFGASAVDAPVAAAVAPAVTSRAVLDWLHGLLHRFTGLSRVADEDDLIQAGVDSVASINLAAEIERRLSASQPVRIRKTLVFDHPTLRAIAAHLLDRHADALAAVLATPRAADAPPAPAASTSIPAPAAVPAAVPAPPASVSPGRDDAIAIVGVAGEFPGADDLDALWALLGAGQEAITAVPPDRWDWRADYAPDPKQAGASYGRHGGFLRRAKQFDPVFFGITPVEAAKIDPQERRLLEIAYHALEDGGHFASPEPATGVFTAAMFGHYQNLEAASGPVSASFSSIANRISFTFDFRGPSLCVDTMCSGSLTALHLAIGSLRSGECRRALVGAVNVMPHPGKLRLLSEGRFLSPSGHCHSFGVEADGYVPGEGAIALLLRPLSDAVAAGDRIHGVIRGSALNAGGRVSGFTVPSARAQEAVIRQALAQAGVDPAEVDCIEAHGTGTSLGDPIEIAALDAAYGRHADHRRRIGSIKSNIGHLESAAGLAGLAKVLLQFRHRRFAPTLHCTLVNPYLQLDTTDFVLSRDAAPWPSSARPRRAGLSAFGAGGSNAHVVLEEAPPVALPAPPARSRHVFVLSARNARALQARATELADWIDRHPDADPYAVACTLALHREHLRVRACFVAADLADCARQLRVWQADAAVARPASTTTTEDGIAAAYLDGRDAPLRAHFPVRVTLSLPHYPFEPTEYWHADIVPERRAPHSPTEAPTETPPATPRAPQDAVAASRLIVLEPCWYPAAPRAAASAGEPVPHCIVVCDAASADALRGRADVSVIVPGDRFECDGPHCIVRPDRHDEGLAAIRHCGGGRPAWLVVLTRALSDPAPEVTAAAHFSLAKAALGSGAIARIACVHGDGERPADFAASALYRVLAMEEPQVRVVSLELEMTAFDDPGSLLRTAIEELSAAGAGGSPDLRIDADRRSAGLRPAMLAANRETSLREGGVYLITGGLGMIGLGVAEALLRRCSARVVLVGRSPQDTAAAARMVHLHGLGGSVEYRQADTTDAAAVHALVRDILHRHGALHGVIHSAGVLRDGLLRGKSREDFDAVIAAKMVATSHLDRETQQLDLDFFVVFSSMSGLFGNIGQADYACGNAWLDAFAAQRRREVLAGRRHGLSLSIDWPLWYDDRGDGPDRMRDYRSLGGYLHDNFGIAPLPLSEGARILIRLIDGADAHMTQLAPFVGDVDRIFASVRDRALHAIAATPAAPSPAATQAAVPAASTASSSLVAPIAGMVGGLTGLAGDDIDPHASYGDLGLNSVMLQELAGEIESRFHVSIPPSALFSHNSITRLADYLATLGAVRPEAATPAVVPMPSAPVVDAPSATQVVPGAGPMPDGRIAIIGIDGRLPGGHDLDEFWQGLIDRQSAIRRVDRWPGLSAFAGTIPDIDHFDAKFFGLSAREATLMDPQHRLFLQCCYNAMLDAGYSPRGLAGVGVFAGVQFSDYQVLLQTSGQGNHPYAATGNAHAMLANRVSYLFDFDGPSQTIDTACSSALVAINRAVLSLRSRECDHALVGAVSLLIDPAMTRAAESMGVLSPRHRCATFDAEADGYVRAEGVGCVLLKRLEDALRDGDAIHAVIEAVAENHGGRANSLTAPNPDAQRRLLLKAYTPDLAHRVGYIETHGTGTKLGDPVEIDALRSAWQALCPGMPAGSIAIGSVKSNVGHLEPAAGIASLLKVVLAFRHRRLPANLHFGELNPYIQLASSPFRIVTEPLAWGGAGRVAGISSFGFGGTNAHVVLSEPPDVAARRPGALGTPALVVLSAKSPRSLLAMKSALEAFLRSPAGNAIDMRDLSTTLVRGREHFEYRLAWVVADVLALVDAMRATHGGDIRRVARGAAAGSALPPAGGGLAQACEAYLAGADPQAMAGIADAGRRIHLPGYAFDTRAYWFETADSVLEAETE